MILPGIMAVYLTGECTATKPTARLLERLKNKFDQIKRQTKEGNARAFYVSVRVTEGRPLN